MIIKDDGLREAIEHVLKLRVIDFGDLWVLRALLCMTVRKAWQR